MRVFLGIGLPSQIRSRVKEFANSISPHLPRMKWVEEENIHITLKFFGETEPEKVDKISEILSTPLKSVKTFNVTLEKLGAFPNSKKARVLWWGLSEGETECVQLFAGIESTLVKQGFPKEEKTYHPHITLARLKFPQSLALDSLPAPTDLSFLATCVTLYESVLTPNGPIYTIIKEFSFDKEAG